MKVVLLNYVVPDGDGDFTHLGDICQALTEMGNDNLPIELIAVVRCPEKKKARFEEKLKTLNLADYYINAHSTTDTFYENKTLQNHLAEASFIFYVSYLAEVHKKRYPSYFNPKAKVLFIGEHERKESIPGGESFSMGLSKGTRGIKIKPIDASIPSDSLIVIQQHDPMYYERLMVMSDCKTSDEFNEKNYLIPAYFNKVEDFFKSLLILSVNEKLDTRKNFAFHFSGDVDLIKELSRDTSAIQKQLIFLKQNITIRQIEVITKEGASFTYGLNSQGTRVIRIFYGFLSEASYDAVFANALLVAISGDNTFERAVRFAALFFYWSYNRDAKKPTLTRLAQIVEKKLATMPDVDEKTKADVRLFFNYKSLDWTYGGDLSEKDNEMITRYRNFDFIKMREVWRGIAKYLFKHHNFYNELKKLILTNVAEIQPAIKNLPSPAKDNINIILEKKEKIGVKPLFFEETQRNIQELADISTLLSNEKMQSLDKYTNKKELMGLSLPQRYFAAAVLEGDYETLGILKDYVSSELFDKRIQYHGLVCTVLEKARIHQEPWNSILKLLLEMGANLYAPSSVISELERLDCRNPCHLEILSIFFARHSQLIPLFIAIGTIKPTTLIDGKPATNYYPVTPGVGTQLLTLGKLIEEIQSNQYKSSLINQLIHLIEKPSVLSFREFDHRINEAGISSASKVALRAELIFTALYAIDLEEVENHQLFNRLLLNNNGVSQATKNYIEYLLKNTNKTIKEKESLLPRLIMSGVSVDENVVTLWPAKEKLGQSILAFGKALTSLSNVEQSNALHESMIFSLRKWLPNMVGQSNSLEYFCKARALVKQQHDLSGADIKPLIESTLSAVSNLAKISLSNKEYKEYIAFLNTTIKEDLNIQQPLNVGSWVIQEAESAELAATLIYYLAQGKHVSDDLRQVCPNDHTFSNKLLNLGAAIDEVENYIGLTKNNTLTPYTAELRQKILTLPVAPIIALDEMKAIVNQCKAIVPQEPRWLVVLSNVALAIAGLGVFYLAAGLFNMAMTRNKHFLFFNTSKGQNELERLEDTLEQLELLKSTPLHG